MSNLNLGAAAVDGTALTAAYLNNWRTTLEAYFNNGASLQAANMADRYVTSYITWLLQADSGAAAITLEHTLEAGVELVPVRLTLKAMTRTGGSLTLDVFDDGVSILNAGALSINSTTEVFTESFTGNVAGGSVLRFVFDGDATPWAGTYVHAVLKVKHLIRS